jgi:GR25 family glycosyltransferase involved in LPS biosynthesis
MFLHTDYLIKTVKERDVLTPTEILDAVKNWPSVMKNILAISFRKERFTRLLCNAGKLKQFIVKIKAIDGRTLDPFSLKTQRLYKPLNEFNELTRGQLGCFMSHRLAWNYVITNSLKHAFIIEDDCDLFPHPEITAYLSKAIDSIDFEWDVLYVGRNPALCKSKRRLRPNVVEVGKTWGLFAYIVTLKGAEKLLKGSQIITTAADIYVSTRNKKQRNISITPMAYFINTDENSDTVSIK